MNQPKRGQQPFNVTDNTECRCFDKPTSEQNYFLQKNKYPKDISPTQFHKMQQNVTKIDLKHSNSKRSLKKEKSREYQKEQPDKLKDAYKQYYAATSNELRFQRLGVRSPPIQTPIKQRGNEYRNTYGQIPLRQNQFQRRSPLLIKSGSAQIFKPPFSFTERMIPPLTIKTIEFTQPRYVSPPISPRMYASSEKMISETTPLTPRYKMEGIIPNNLQPRVWRKADTIMNQQAQVQSQFNITKIPQKKVIEVKELRDRTIRSRLFDTKPKEKDHQLFVEQIKKKPEQISSYEQQPLKSIIREDQLKSKIFYDRNKLNIPGFQSRIDPKRSCLDDGTGKSKIALKKAKQQKAKLKKMDDVEEIKSMIDSEEMMSDDDKQSVVLARLNQYGSFVDATLSVVESRPITFMSKVAYQSTTAEKSMVKGYQYSYK